VMLFFERDREAKTPGTTYKDVVSFCVDRDWFVINWVDGAQQGFKNSDISSYYAARVELPDPPSA